MDFYFSPPSEKPEDEFWSGVWDIYIELVAADKAARALAAAPPPLHHQSPPSEIHSDHLRSQVTPQSPPSSSPPLSPVPKSAPRPESEPPPEDPTPLPIRFPSTTHAHADSFPSHETLAANPFPNSAQTGTLTPPTSPSPFPHPLYRSENPPDSAPLFRSRIPADFASSPVRENPPPPPLPFSSTTNTHTNPTPTQMRSHPQPRIFPSHLPLRETLAIPKSPPLSRPVPVPPPHTHEFQQQQTQTQQPAISPHSSSTAKKKIAEEEEKKKKRAVGLQQQSISEKTVEMTLLEQKLGEDSLEMECRIERGKKLFFEHISIKESRKGDLKKTVETFEEDNGDGITESENLEHKSGLTKKNYQSGSIAYKDPKELTLLFEQKLEIELILIGYVDSPPTSDVSTIRGRIVFKKGRMIPNIMGLDRGRTRPPRARLKDRDPPLLFRLC